MPRSRRTPSGPEEPSGMGLTFLIAVLLALRSEQPSPTDARALLVLEQGARVRTEHFAASGADGRPAATAEILRLRSSRSRWQLHRSVEIDGQAPRWHQVEVFQPDGVRVVFREVVTGGGRSVRSEWRPGGSGASHLHGEAHATEAALATCTRSIARLGLYELARRGRPVDGSWRLLEPTSGLFEPITLRSIRGPGPLAPRAIELHDERGQPRGAAWFVGAELLAFRDGSSSPWFRRVPAP